MYTVYVLYSPKYGKIYIGYTSNLKQRMLSHNELSTKGWTIKYRPWIIVFIEEFETKSEAIAREKKLKNASNREKKSKNESESGILALFFFVLVLILALKHWV